MRKGMWRMVVMFTACIGFMEGVAAQSGSMTVPSRGIALKQALEEIQRRTGYTMIVNYDDLPISKEVLMPSENLRADELTKRVLAGTGYTCEVIGRRILIVPEPPAIDDGEGAFSAIRRSAEDDESVEMEIVTFRSGGTVLEAGFMDNAAALGQIDRSLTDTAVIARLDHISVTAASSPDGSTVGNERLAVRRAQTTRDYIEKRYPHIAPEKVYAFSAGEEWSGLRKLVAEDGSVPERDEVLDLLDTIPPDANIRDSIGMIGDGRAWRYISSELLPHLRGAAAITLHFKNPFVEKRTDTLSVARPTGVTMEGSGVRRVEFLDVAPPAVVEQPPAPEHPAVGKPLFAVKTNVLADLVGAVNLEAEVPLGERWSLAGEVMFPWWMTVSGTLEARYWFGERAARPLLTGWFTGVYFGGGTYDMRWNHSLHRGDFLHAGFSGGYAHQVGRSGNMRMEYSLGAGRLAGTERTLSGERKNFNWFGPTRAKVSLVWMICRRSSE